MPRHADTSQYSAEENLLWERLIESQWQAAAGETDTGQPAAADGPPAGATDRKDPAAAPQGNQQRGRRGNTRRVYATTRGLPFTYSIRGNELFISRREKSITRSTVNMAYRKACEMGGVVKGPKKLGVFGASYLYAVFAGIGIIRSPAQSPMQPPVYGQDSEMCSEMCGEDTGQQRLPEVSG